MVTRPGGTLVMCGPSRPRRSPLPTSRCFLPRSRAAPSVPAAGPGRTVLDMFSGSGTTGLAAAELGHRYVGIDINVDYLELSLRTRLEQPSLIIE